MKIQLRTEVVTLPPCGGAAVRPSPFQFLYEVDVRPAASAAFEEYLRHLVASAWLSRAPQTWSCFQVVSGGPTTRYFVELPFARHAEKDAWLQPAQALVRAFGPREGLRLQSEASRAVERVTSSELRLLPELSGRAAARPGRRALLRSIRVRLDKSREYLRFLGRLADAEEAAGGPAATRRVAVRGGLGRYTETVLFDRDAELDAWPEAATVLAGHYGRDEAQRLLEAADACAEDGEELELALRPELSRQRLPLAAR